MDSLSQLLTKGWTRYTDWYWN